MGCPHHSEPQANALLLAWEEGLHANPVRRALLLLRAGEPDLGEEAWAGIPIGERDRTLLRLRERWFGRELQTVAPCPQCGERLESSFLTADLERVAPDPLDPGEAHGAALGVVEDRGYEVRFRLPTSSDLERLFESSPDRRGPLLLLSGCVTDARLQGSPVEATTLPESLLERIAHEMERRDPAACIQLSLRCPCCGHPWLATFDIAAHLWGDVDDWAQQLLDDVHTLASAYGWSESQILSLGATRRQLYLQRVQG